MARIKFTHTYKKLVAADGKPIKTAKLLLVLVVSQDAIRTMKDFIEYDTDNGKYAIPYASFYLLLVFQKPDGNLFTSVRTQWNQAIGNKKPYYDNLIGQTLDIVITDQVFHHA